MKIKSKERENVCVSKMWVSKGINGDLSPYTSQSKKSADPSAPAPATWGGKKKSLKIGVRAWIAVNSAGEAKMVEDGKQAIMSRTGVPARDLRILDPQLSYPSTILGRDRAIVINLEHIKAVITAHEVLVINSRDPSVSPFVQQLQRRFSHKQGHQIKGDGSHGYDQKDFRSIRSRPENYGNLDYSQEDENQTEMDDKQKLIEAGNLANSNGHKVLPFEFIALEACLKAACSCLEIEARTLENEAHPALDKLTAKISTLNLEHVRQIKSRLVAISGRVQKVRDELEHLLDDDEDMAEMYLTSKLLQQQQSNGSPQSFEMDQASSLNEGRIPSEYLWEENDMENHSNHVISGSSGVYGDGYESHTFSTRTSFKHRDVEELEMLLEAYFVQIDSTLNKLSTLREYVDDTEDYINIMLDDKQNYLLQMGVVMTTATLIVSAFVVLVAIFGMNIKVDLFDENKAGTTEFVWTVGGGAVGSLLLYVAAVSWCKHKGILD